MVNFTFLFKSQDADTYAVEFKLQASLHHPFIGLGIAQGNRSMMRSKKMKYREILVSIILSLTFHLNTSPVFAQTDPFKTVNAAIPFPPGGEVGGVIESVDVTGVVLTPLDTNSLEQAVGELVAEGVEAIADYFLFSFANPAHERFAAEFIQTRHSHLMVLISSDVDPAFRELEQTEKG